MTPRRQFLAQCAGGLALAAGVRAAEGGTELRYLIDRFTLPLHPLFNVRIRITVGPHSLLDVRSSSAPFPGTNNRGVILLQADKQGVVEAVPEEAEWKFLLTVESKAMPMMAITPVEFSEKLGTSQRRVAPTGHNNEEVAKMMVSWELTPATESGGQRRFRVRLTTTA